MLWHLEIQPAPGQPDLAGKRFSVEAAEAGIPGPWTIAASRGFLIEGTLRPGRHRPRGPAGAGRSGGRVVPGPSRAVARRRRRIGRSCLPRPGVTDPEAESAGTRCATWASPSTNVRTIRTYRIDGPGRATAAADPARAGQRRRRAGRRRAPCRSTDLGQGSLTTSSCIEVPIRAMDDQALLEVEPVGTALAQPRRDADDPAAISRELGRDPTDCELETLAQTWSEHCSHKTLRGRIEFEGRTIDNLLKQTIFNATRELEPRLAGERLHRQRGRRPVRRRARRLLQGRDPQPSLGDRSLRRRQHRARRRDPRRRWGPAWAPSRSATPTSSAWPRPTCRPTQLPAGVLHPKRVLKGVVAGVRDYGNRMGIPTVNGALGGRSRLPGQSAGLLRHGGRDAPRACRSRRSSRATGSSPSAAGPAATASTAPPSARPS